MTMQTETLWHRFEPAPSSIATAATATERSASKPFPKRSRLKGTFLERWAGAGERRLCLQCRLMASSCIPRWVKQSQAHVRQGRVHEDPRLGAIFSSCAAAFVAKPVTLALWQRRSAQPPGPCGTCGDTWNHMSSVPLRGFSHVPLHFKNRGAGIQQ